MPDLLSIETWRLFFTRHGSKMGWGLAAVIGLPLVVGFGLNQFGGRNRDNDNRANLTKAFLKVNGEEVPRLEFEKNLQRLRGAAVGEEMATQQGQIIDQLVTQIVVQQEAKKRNAKPDEALVDRVLASERDQALGPKASDAEWRSFVLQAHGLSLSEYREEVSKRALGPALGEIYKAEEKVTEQDAKNQNAEVKLSLVLIPTLSANSFARPKQMPKPMPDADAKKMADALQAEAKTGKDIAEIARKNSADFSSKRGGDLGWQKEFAIPEGGSDALNFGKDWDAAVQKTATGQVTDVVKVSGFSPGYAFAKVMERRLNLPKDFDVKKVTEKLKEQRSREKIGKFIEEQIKVAKVEVLDPDAKAYYDYFQWKKADMQLQQQQFAAQMGQAGTGKAPTKDETERLLKSAEAGFEGILKRSPKDATASLVIAQILKTRQNAAGLTPQQRDEIRERLIKLYEVALESTENRTVRMELADLYRGKNQSDLAEKQYTMITRLLNVSPSYDSSSAEEAKGVHTTLASRFMSINKPDAAEKERAAIVELDKQIAEYKRKENEAKAKAAAQKGQPGGAPQGGISLPAGGSVNVTPGGGATAPPIQVTPQPEAAPGKAPAPPTETLPK